MSFVLDPLARVGTGLRRLSIRWVAPSLVLAMVGCADQGGPVVDTVGVGMGGECGNGMLEADEICDDGNDDPRDACTNQCLAAACGDGVIGPGETCDDGDDDDADACTNACTPGPAAVTSVSLGEYHTCALSQQGLVRCWGASDFGRLGQPGYDENIGDDEPPSDWDPVSVADDVIALASGEDHNCALRASGAVRCWGHGGYGKLGYGNTDDIGDDEAPSDAGDVPLPGAVAGLGLGSNHSCAVFEDGNVACWGSNGTGQLGLGHTEHIGNDETVDATHFVSLPGPAVQVVAGAEHSCARLQGGDVVCWGRQAEGQLGYGTPDNIGDDETVDTVGAVPLGGPAIHIAAQHNHTCAVIEGGAVRCWGAASSGQLGNGDTKNVGDRKTPEEFEPVALEEAAVEVVAGRSFSCAVLSTGTVRCWGSSDALGVPDLSGSQLEPQTFAHIGGPVQQVVAGYNHTCAVLDGGTLRCWGSNTGGSLGYPDESSYNVYDAGMAGDVDVF